MASKRDQLQAAQFLGQRVTSALIAREADPEQPPFRRPATAGIGSIALAVLAVAAVAVYGIVVPGGNDAWRDGKSVIVEKETGTRFVYLDGRLHPVQNYASALLALSSHADTQRVSRASLDGVPRGPRIGIPDAPDALPGADGLVGGGATLCSRDGRDATGAAVAQSVLAIGAGPAGAGPLGEDAVLVEAAGTGEQFLLQDGYRHRIADPDATRAALGPAAAEPVPVTMSFLDVLPAGEDIAPIRLERTGRASAAAPGTSGLRIGQVRVAETSDGALAHYLVEADELRRITPLQYDIQLAYPPTATAYGGDDPEGMPLTLAAASRATVAPLPALGSGSAPAETPPFAAQVAGRPLCAAYDGASAMPRITLGGQLPADAAMAATAGRTVAGTPLADMVYVPPGRAALIEAMPSADAPAGSLLLVSDQGRAYPLADPRVAGMLGYDGVEPMRLPGGLVARIPIGSGLDPAAALET